MQIRTRYILIALVFLAIAWILQTKAIDSVGKTQLAVTLQQLHNTGKLPIKEQDILLNNLETDQLTYPFLFVGGHSVSAKMGYYVDPTDTIHNVIADTKDTIVINAALKTGYVKLDATTLQDLEEVSRSGKLVQNKNEVIHYFEQKALEQNLPRITAILKLNPPTDQEKQLSDLTGRPVKIVFTQMPVLN